LRPLPQAPKEEFCEAKGLGAAKYVQLQAVLEMARRHLMRKSSDETSCRNPQATRRYLLAQMRDLSHEVFAALFLDNQHRVISFAPLASGTLDGAAVYPREVVKAALKHGAAAVIFAHNTRAASPSLRPPIAA